MTKSGHHDFGIMIHEVMISWRFYSLLLPLMMLRTNRYLKINTCCAIWYLIETKIHSHQRKLFKEKKSANISGTDFGTQRENWKKKHFETEHNLFPIENHIVQWAFSLIPNMNAIIPYSIFFFSNTHDFGICVRPASTVFTQHLW